MFLSHLQRLFFKEYFVLKKCKCRGLPQVAQWQKSTCSTGHVEMGVQSLSWEDPLEGEMAVFPSILAWEIPWTEESGGLQPMGSQKSQTQWSD